MQLQLTDVNNHLKTILGNTYGGPSISIENNKFVIYRWYDAPVGMDILSEGETLEECIQEYLQIQRFGSK